MKHIPLLIGLSLILNICGKAQVIDKKTKSYYDQVINFTKDELPVYIVLNVPTDNQDVDKILISSLELYWLEFNYLNFNEEYIDTLLSLLTKRVLRPANMSQSQINDYKIDLEIFKSLSNKAAKEVFQEFFDELGRPKDNFSEDQIEAASAFLFEKNVLVHQGKAALYNVYYPPK